MNLHDMVRCPRLRRDVTTDECESGYCAADALHDRGSVCWRCEVGMRVRATMAKGWWNKRDEVTAAYLGTGQEDAG